MTRDEVKTVMKAFRTAYGERFVVSTEVVDLWTRLMDDLACDDVLTSADEWMKASQYPPTIADIRKSVEKLERDRWIRREVIRQEFDAIVYPQKDEEDRAVFYALVYSLPEEKWVDGARFLNRSANRAAEEAEGDVEKLENVLRKAAKR